MAKKKSKKNKYAKKMRMSAKAMVLIILVIILAFLGVLYAMTNTPTENSEQPTAVSPSCLVANPNKFQKSICEDLAKAVTDEDKAILTAASFAVDYFTWNNKSQRNEIGGRFYILEEYRDQFQEYHVYGYYFDFLESLTTYNKNGLPEVIDYTVLNTRKGYYEFDSGLNIKEDDVYEVTIGIDYKNNVSGMPIEGLPTSIIVTVFKSTDGAFYVAKAE